MVQGLQVGNAVAQERRRVGMFGAVSPQRYVFNAPRRNPLPPIRSIFIGIELGGGLHRGWQG